MGQIEGSDWSSGGPIVRQMNNYDWSVGWSYSEANEGL